jgi:hypothetical protein
MRQSLKNTIMAVFLIVSFLIFMSSMALAQYSNPPKGSGSGGGTPSDTNPAMNGTAAAGTGTNYSRSDHVHPTDTSKQDALTLPASPAEGHIVTWGANNKSLGDGGDLAPDNSTANHILKKDGSGNIADAAAGDFPTLDQVPTATVSSGDITVTANNAYVICTTTCNITVKAPAAGVQLCARNAPGSATVITLVNMGAGKYYEKTDNSAWATANQKLVSGGVATDKICIVGYDATHYATMSSTGTWTDTAP